MSLPAEHLVAERYELRELLVQTVRCQVYEGFDRILQRRVLIKIIAPPYWQVYEDAIRHSAHLEHSSIIYTYDLIKDGSNLYLVQEFVRNGTSLADLQQPLSPLGVLSIGIQLCEVLEYARQSIPPLVHGDLLPSSVILDGYGDVHVSNFALPTDFNYYEQWQILGNAASVLHDKSRTFGEYTILRYRADTRAVALTLYQLLQLPHSMKDLNVLPQDAQLHFSSQVPVEVAKVLSRALVEQHITHISTTLELLDGLRTVYTYLLHVNQQQQSLVDAKKTVQSKSVKIIQEIYGNSSVGGSTSIRISLQSVRTLVVAFLLFCFFFLLSYISFHFFL